MAYFIALDRAFTPCSLETFDRGLRSMNALHKAALQGAIPALRALLEITFNINALD
jgi:hypothetical protein